MRKSKSKIFTILLTLIMAVITVTACGKTPSTSTSDSTSTSKVKQEVVDLTGVNGDGSTLRMSVLYTDTATRMKFDSTYGNYVSKADGKRYQSGAWKPTWAELQTRLSFTITDATPEKAQSVSNAFELLQANSFKSVDVVSGPVSGIVDEGTRNGTFVNLADYKAELPNFFNYLEENEIVEKSITSDDGSIYYAPYLDGFNDIETMFICRVDWVEKLLDSDTTVYDTERTLSANTNAVAYQGYYDSMNTTFEAAKSATEKQSITLSYTSGNGVIAKQNALAKKNGKELTKVLKDYIKANYIDKGYISKPSELFCGQTACYNADELIALWRCIYTNPYLMSGIDKTTTSEIPDVVPFYPRTRTADRANQVLQLAQIWGVRGYDSRNGYFYFDEQGNLQDARVSDDMMESLTFLNQIYSEGLILHDYMKDVRTDEHRDYYNKQNLGFMTYDYNQTTSIYNETLTDSQKNVRNISPVLFPVADWDNKATKVANTNSYSVTTNDLYAYTESWRSVKTEGWAITYATTTDKAKFAKALQMLDYMYSPMGQVLMTYGPDSYIRVKDATVTENTKEAVALKYHTIPYKGEQVPEIKDVVITELKDKNLGKGNYTNYYRYYVGSTLPLGFEKEQGMEYQTVDTKGLNGLDCINNAVTLGTLQHASVTRNTAKLQNTLVPTTFALSDTQTNTVNNQTLELGKNFNNSSAAGQNVFHTYVMNGFNVTGTTLTKEALVEKINGEWKLNTYLRIYQNAYKKMYGLN